MAGPDPLAGLGISPTPPTQAPTKQKINSPIGAPANYQQPGSITGGGPDVYGAIGIVPGPYGVSAPPSGPGTQKLSGGTFYVDGQEWAPLNDPGSIPTLQAELVQAGLLTARDVRVGVWDATAAAAYKVALAFANHSGMNVVDALGVLIQNKKLGSTAAGSSGSGSGGSTANTAYQITNPQDAADEYKTAAQTLTGQAGRDADAMRFAAYFQSQERNAGQAAQTATSGAVTAAPSLSNAAQDYVKQQDPNAVMAYGMASRSQEFLNMLGSATGQ